MSFSEDLVFQKVFKRSCMRVDMFYMLISGNSKPIKLFPES